MYGGAQACTTTLCSCCGVSCNMANLLCRACTNAYYAAGCGGGGTTFYITCHSSLVADGKTGCCTYVNLCRRCGTLESGNGLVVVEW
jgi:hypothetical protein